MGLENIAIDLKNIVKIFGEGDTTVKAVNDVSLHIEKGEIVLIMGPSGSGKSTILQIVGALLQPTEGNILINDLELLKLSSKKKAKLRLKTFGFIYQSPNLLEALTALQNVQIVIELTGENKKVSKQKAIKLLEDLDLEHRLNHKPSKLSGGEQQRVAIARALANDPKIILADEPTASLDSKSGYNVVKILKSIAKDQGKTVLIVTHDTRIKNLADRILWLEDGKLKVQWKPDGTEVDPVCLMVCDPKKTKYFHKYNESIYYFCGETCLYDFRNNPDKYLFGSNRNQ